MQNTFMFMADLIRTWLEGARLEEIARVLRLIDDELSRRGFALTWSTTPPMRDRSQNF